MNKTTNQITQVFAVLSDDEIIKRIISGERELYEVIIRRYNAYLYKTGRSYGYNHQDTEDLMQETYVSSFYSLSKFEHRSSFKTWLVKIFLNFCYQKRNKSSFLSEKAMDNEIIESAVPQFTTVQKTENNIMNKELGQVIETALSKLPLEYRIIFSLRELNGFNVAETAATLNITESNVKTRLSRAKSMLRAAIEKKYSPDDIFEFNLIYCDRVVLHVMNLIRA